MTDLDAYKCAPGCMLYHINDGVCQPACLTEECGMDGTDCRTRDGNVTATTAECAPGCTHHMINNKKCDPACDVEACGFDSLACEAERLEFRRDAISARGAECDATKCPPYVIGDGTCNLLCHNKACHYDGGDCQGQPPQEGVTGRNVVTRGVHMLISSMASLVGMQ